MKINVSMDLTVEQAFQILLDTLHVELDDDPPKFKIDDGEIVCDCDDRGELYLALYHLATKIFPNTEFRHLFDDPNTLINKLYMAKEIEPCDDYISRQAVLCEIDKQFDLAKPFKQLIKSMPSVKPKPKTGYWIYKKELNSSVCSECGNICFQIENYGPLESNYCPTCGLKMVKPQESEDK